MENQVEHMKEMSSLLDKIKDPLESTLKDSEPIFMKVGQELQAVYSDAMELSRQTTDMAKLISDDSHNALLKRIETLSRDSLEKLESSGNNVTTIIQEVETNLTNLQILYSKAPVLKKISKSLNMVILNMAIESRRTEECERVFEYFVGDIKELVSKVTWIANNMFDESKSASSEQASALKGISERRTQLMAIADTARDMVTESLTKIEQVFKISLEAINEVTNHSNAISKQVGEAVFAIQFDDITRQQVEHILEAFEDIKRIAEETDIKVDTDENTGTLGTVRSMLILQAAQLKQVISEIEKAHANIDKAFKEIGSEVEMLMSGVSSLGITSTMEDSRYAGPLADLITGLENLNSIMDEGTMLSKQIEQTMMQSANEASALSDYLSQIEDISLDLHMKAINAVIMSNKLGKDGIALSVLAQEVSDISQESDVFASDVMDVLNSISDLSKKIADVSSKKAGTRETEREDCDKALKDRIKQVSNTYDTILENSVVAADKSGVLQDKIISTESNIKFLNKLKIKFNEYLNGINDAVLYLDHFAGEESERELGHLSERYTMESERGIHGTVTTGIGRSCDEGFINSPDNLTQNNPRGLANEDCADYEGDDLSDNVELF